MNLKGADGNANVTRYVFPSYDFYSNGDVTLNIDDDYANVNDVLDDSVLVYLQRGTTRYYHVPGRGYSGQTEYYVYQMWRGLVGGGLQLEVHIKIADGVGESYDYLVVIRVESGNSTQYYSKNGGAGDTFIPRDLDVSNYNKVAEYFGFGTAGKPKIYKSKVR